jgi:N-acetylglucosaminyldiphosphoundecaprenol N-acetyl-beta-D-mannosaminyltransferase
MSRTHLLNCPVDSLSLTETVDEIIHRIRLGKPMQHCVVNTFKFLLMHKDPTLRSIVRNCDIINADGQSAVWALKILRRPIKERVTGIDLMEALIARAAREEISVYFFGAKPHVVQKVVEIYQEKYPNLRIAGFQHGYFRRSGEEPLAVQAIHNARPDILLVALDSPRKEYWLAKHLTELNVPFSMGVGGSFDVVVGQALRAPKWMQEAGLEWFWRMKQDPRRMWKRYLKSNTLFGWLILKELLRRNRDPDPFETITPRKEKPDLAHR